MNGEPLPYHLPFSYRFNRRARIIVSSRVLVDHGGDHLRTVYIAGTGRSGTTWLSDLVNYRNQYRQIFEPFHPEGPVGSVFPRHLYLRPGSADSLRLSTAREVLSGNVRGRFVDRFNKRLISSRRVIKDISSNLFLKWLHDHFPGLPIVLIMRHPCAVLRSQTKVDWEKMLDRMLRQELLVQDHLEPFVAELKGLRYAFEHHIAMWCIQNYVALRQFGPAEIHVTFYEHLCTKPEEEIRALMSYLGKPFDHRVLEAVGVASLMAHGHSAIFNGKALVDSWKDELTVAEVRRAIEIVAMFGLDAIYSEDPMPCPVGVTRMLATAGQMERVGSRAG
jgi:Sulfotransferase domain